MTWTEIKTLLAAMEPAAFKGLINTTSGTTPEAALYARAVNMEICGNPHKFTWLLREYVLTLTGATEYNLRTLIPDLDRVFQVYGSNLPGREAPYQSLGDYNIDMGGGVRITIMGDTLKITGASSGTISIPYFSRYLVQATGGGARQLDFSLDTDVSVIPEQHVMMLIEGILRFVNRKQKQQQFVQGTKLDRGGLANLNPFDRLLQQAILADQPIHKVIRDFRYNPA